MREGEEMRCHSISVISQGLTTETSLYWFHLTEASRRGREEGAVSRR